MIWYTTTVYHMRYLKPTSLSKMTNHPLWKRLKGARWSCILRWSWSVYMAPLCLKGEILIQQVTNNIQSLQPGKSKSSIPTRSANAKSGVLRCDQPQPRVWKECQFDLVKNGWTGCYYSAELSRIYQAVTLVKIRISRLVLLWGTNNIVWRQMGAKRPLWDTIYRYVIFGVVHAPTLYYWHWAMRLIRHAYTKMMMKRNSTCATEKMTGNANSDYSMRHDKNVSWDSIIWGNGKGWVSVIIKSTNYNHLKQGFRVRNYNPPIPCSKMMILHQPRYQHRR